ncbi:MAG: excinuclease ABC subunit UvrC [Candidatus Peribacteraceae bacterium]|nr:excinuclease ABC subunit UvrC [Candidatus Peribacteraceae bacterium]
MKNAENNPHLPELKKRVAKASSKPGIYKWLDENGGVLYIGKAKNLKNRLKSYVQKTDKNLGPWKLSLIEHIADFDVTITANELEALVLETNLIKEKKPKYNVLMKDDKNYVYVRISLNEIYPSVSIVRNINDDNAKYFGPYLSAFDTKKLLDVLHMIYEYKEEGKDLDRLNRAAKKGDKSAGIKPSLEYQIGQSCGVSIGKITKEEYLKRIDKVVNFFKGKTQEATKKANEIMMRAAQNKKFERAASLRDAMKIIDNMKEKQIASNTSGENADYISIAMLNGKAQAVVLKERNGKVIDEQSITLKGQSDTEEEALEQFIQQFYVSTIELPDFVCISKIIEDEELISTWLTKRKGKKVELLVPERGKKAQLLLLAQKNAEEKLKAQEEKWEAAAKNIEDALKELANNLDLENAPKRIEGYDISHLGGTETVGSMVVAQNGKPSNKDYRSFTIKTLKEGDIDDYKALEEVLRRRLNHLVADIKTEEEIWKNKGILFGRAKKAEQKLIEEIMKEHPNDFHIENINYKDFLVGRKDNNICTFARMCKYKNEIIELKSLWVDNNYKGSKLGQFLCRKILSKYKKEKVYATIHPKLESYYSEIGFRHLHTIPKVIEEKIKDMKKKDGDLLESMTMVSLPNERKIDASLATKPNLIVVDGGKGQLSSAVKVLKELELCISVIGLAKQEEEVFIPDESNPIAFKKDSPAKFLLMRLRNEAHRFANTHREKRQSKRMIGSALDEVLGIGPHTKKELLDKFGNIDGIVSASDNELKEILSEAQIDAIRKKL